MTSAGGEEGLRGERVEPLGAPTDPLRPTGRVGQASGPRPPLAPASLKARRLLVALAVGLVLLPILLWIGALLFLASL